MDDAFGMGSGKRLRNMQPNLASFAPRNSRLTQALANGLSLQQFHDGEAYPFDVADIVNRQDVGMRQRRDGLGLALETQQGVGVLGELFRKNFDGDIAIEPEIACPINFAHPPSAKRGKDLI